MNLADLRRQIRRVRSFVDVAQTEIETLRRLVPPDRPLPFTVTITGEDLSTMPSRIKFNVQLPTLPAPHDVVKRELTVNVPDVAPDVHEAAPGDAFVNDLFVPQDADVVLSLVDIDDGGNRSEAREFSFKALDTVPPPQPGEFAVQITGEEVTE